MVPADRHIQFRSVPHSTPKLALTKTQKRHFIQTCKLKLDVLYELQQLQTLALLRDTPKTNKHIQLFISSCEFDPQMHFHTVCRTGLITDENDLVLFSY
jgi:hypothetical protein